MDKTDIAKLVRTDLEAEFQRYRNSELHKHPLTEKTEEKFREDFKGQRLDWWRKFFGWRVTLTDATGMLLGFSEGITKMAVFVDAFKANRRAPRQPIGHELVKAFTDMRDTLGAAIQDKELTDSNGTFEVIKVFEWAKEKGFVADEVLAEWEKYNDDKATPTAEQPPSRPAGPAPVTTVKVAQAFDGLHGWNIERWKTNLGNKPLWLKACMVTEGDRGKRQITWNPVLIGAALHNQGVKQNQIRARFQREGSLIADWFEVWKDYEAEFLDTP